LRQAPPLNLKLVDWLKAHPERGSYSTPGAGTLPHFFAVLFGRQAGLDLRHVSYRGASAAPNDLLTGQVPLVFANTGELIELHRAGRIRILATSNMSRLALLPAVPTFQEVGYPIAGAGWHGVFASQGTPSASLDQINRLITTALQKEKVRERVVASSATTLS